MSLTDAISLGEVVRAARLAFADAVGFNASSSGLIDAARYELLFDDWLAKLSCFLHSSVVYRDLAPPVGGLIPKTAMSLLDPTALCHRGVERSATCHALAGAWRGIPKQITST